MNDVGTPPDGDEFIIFEAWGDEEGATLFAPRDACLASPKEPTDVPLFSIRSRSWVEAMIAYNEIRGWKRYVPMSSDE